MARGWESKSIEAQQAEFSDQSTQARTRMNPAEAGRWREKESLRLSRQRVLQQIASSRDPRYRKLMEDTLAELDERIRKLV